MRILINGLTLKVGGARTVLVGTLRALARYAPEHDYVVYASERLDPPMPSLPPNFRVRHLPEVERSGWRVFLWEQLVLPVIVRRERVDAMYSMCSGHGPRFPGCRQLVLLHNSTWFVSASEGVPGLSSRTAPLRRALARLAVRGSDAVLVQTRAMARRVSRFIPGAARKIVVSPQGVPEFEEPEGLEAERRALRDGLADFRERHDFIALSVGYYERHKDLETLVEAAELVVRERPGFGLVLTLERTWCRKAEELARRAESGPLRGHALLLGLVPHALLPDLYRACDVFCFPSLLESYGLPMVEAMSHGLPVIAADTPVNREVCGASAVYHRPRDAVGLAERLHVLARDPVLRKTLIGRAGGRARELTWPAHAGNALRALRGERWKRPT